MKKNENKTPRPKSVITTNYPRTKNALIRHPNLDEKMELAKWRASQENREAEFEDLLFVENCSVAVVDHYISDGPGYRGKVMMVVWPGDPSLNNVFVWNPFDNTMAEA